MSRVVLKPSVEKELRRIPAHVAARFFEAVPRLEKDARRRRPGLDVRRLRGRSGLWRLRIGDYGAIHALEGTVIRVVQFLKRENAYDWLD